MEGGLLQSGFHGERRGRDAGQQQKQERHADQFQLLPSRMFFLRCGRHGRPVQQFCLI